MTVDPLSILIGLALGLILSRPPSSPGGGYQPRGPGRPQAPPHGGSAVTPPPAKDDR